MASKLSLGFNTTFIGMGIVFIVLVVLWLIVAIETRVIKAFSKSAKSNNIKPEESNINKTDETVKMSEIQKIKNGKTSGEAVIDGNVDDDIIPVILAAVSEYSDIPINQLKIKSIKSMQ